MDRFSVVGMNRNGARSMIGLIGGRPVGRSCKHSPTDADWRRVSSIATSATAAVLGGCGSGGLARTAARAQGEDEHGGQDDRHEDRADAAELLHRSATTWFDRTTWRLRGSELRQHSGD